jgi:hypothetical protein
MAQHLGFVILFPHVSKSFLMRREPEELVEVGAISGALNIPLGIVKVFNLREKSGWVVRRFKFCTTSNSADFFSR